MNRSSSQVANPPQAPKTAVTNSWLKGPPSSNSPTASNSRPQSPAPSQQGQPQRHPSHSRRSSQLTGVDGGVAIARNVSAAKSGSSLSFGSVNGGLSTVNGSELKTPPSTIPAPSASSIPAAPKIDSKPSVQAFGSIDAVKSSIPSSSKPTVPVASSSTASSTTAASSATPSTRPKFDVKALFQSQTALSASEDSAVTVPTTRTNSQTPAVPSQPQNVSGPTGPGPHTSHPYSAPFVPSNPNMRKHNNSTTPRSPSFQRTVPGGVPGRPPGANAPAPNANSMPSPRPQHQPHIPPQQVPTPVTAMPPQHMPPQHNMPPQWPGYYVGYPYHPGMPMTNGEHWQYAPQWPMHVPQALPGQPITNGPPPTPHTPQQHAHNIAMSSPRQPPHQLQGSGSGPGTPPTNQSAPLPGTGARLNLNANTFVPGQSAPVTHRPTKVVIKDASGHELDLNGLRKQGGTPSTPSTPAAALSADKGVTRRAIKIESEEEKAKREEERKAREAKEEREKREAAEAEQRKRSEEEARVKEERKKQEEEEERKRKAKEEEARLAAEEEEKRLLKEAEEKERERLKLEELERERVEKEKLAREEEERKREEQAREEERLKDLEKEKETKAMPGTPSTPSLEIRSKKEGEAARALSDAPASETSTKRPRPIPGPLDLSTTTKQVNQPLPSALATARHLQNVYDVQYPEGIKSPKIELNTNVKDGKFRYDRDFLLQFMSVCKEKPDNLPPLEAIGLEPTDQTHSMHRTGSGRRGVTGAPPSSASRQGSVGLGLGPMSAFAGKGPGFPAMGNFAAPNKLSSEERFNRSTSMGAGMPFPGGRPSPMVRSSSQGGVNAMGNKRTRSKRGEATRNDSNRISTTAAQLAASQALEPVAPLELSANRWVAGSASRKPVDEDSPEVVDKKVRSLLNKLTMEKFESISNQIITWANKSENEKDGHTLIQVIRLVFEKATDEANWSEMYARLCRKMMEQISSNVQDDGIRNAEGKPIAGGLLFRKYLLNRCQEDFERGWSNKESTAAAAAVKASEDEATRAANEASKDKGGESALYSDEYYIAQKAKRQGLGLVKFIGELFKLQMLTERIMHECIKKLLSNVENPEEEEIESLCKLLTTVGQSLDTSKARGHMDVYFSRMKELAKSPNVSSRMQFMLQDVIELRDRKWASRNLVAAPATIAQIHEAAAKEKAQQEQHNMARAAMSRGGSRRGHDRDNVQQVGPDGWAVASGSRPSNKAGDLSGFGKIQKSGPATFGPSSIFSGKKGAENKRESASLSRASSSANMFQMLQASDGSTEMPPPPSRGSRPHSRTPSIDVGAEPHSRPKLNLLPRTKPLQDQSEQSPSRAGDEEQDGESQVTTEPAKTSASKEQAKKRVEEDSKEFFSIKDLGEGEEYFSTLPTEHRHLLVEKLVTIAVYGKETDAELVSNLFVRVNGRNLCSPASFEDGFIPIAEQLDDIKYDSPKALQLMSIMLKSVNFDDERRTRIASKSMDSDKLLALLT